MTMACFEDAGVGDTERVVREAEGKWARGLKDSMPFTAAELDRFYTMGEAEFQATRRRSEVDSAVRKALNQWDLTPAPVALESVVWLGDNSFANAVRRAWRENHLVDTAQTIA